MSTSDGLLRNNKTTNTEITPEATFSVCFRLMPQTGFIIALKDRILKPKGDMIAFSYTTKIASGFSFKESSLISPST